MKPKIGTIDLLMILHHVIKRNEEKFLSFNKFDNMLDTFYTEFLSGKELSLCGKFVF